MSKTPSKVGIIGCGAISTTYIKNSKLFDAFDIIAVADKRLEAAKSRASEFDIPKAYTPEELLADPEVEIVINLTPHSAHGPVGIATLEAGKSVYNEKPLAVYREDGQKMLSIAKEKNLRVGGAPDTFFGGAWQTARKLIDDGVIGDPIGASACLMAYNAPRPEKPQTGPDGYLSFYRTDFFTFGVTWSFDRGPYYLAALINLLGPVRRITSSTSKVWPEVKTPTHFAGILDFANGAVCTFLITSDFYGTGLPHIEIYGTKGSLRCIDPNNFGGQIFLRKPDKNDLVPVECTFGYNQNGRGVGVADMAVAIRNNRPHRANGEVAYHVVDIVNALHEASSQDRHIYLKSTCSRPAPLPAGLADWTIDD
ncbi:Gfo/Idh/MocA family oxidoreductase [Candidatus Poribacteria bacterium]|nr:Gfo/Idh/MocA family oxidoreductase [Candidatus Poribacteria bacterium]